MEKQDGARQQPLRARHRRLGGAVPDALLPYGDLPKPHW
jgi:hypothetical protein